MVSLLLELETLEVRLSPREALLDEEDEGEADCLEEAEQGEQLVGVAAGYEGGGHHHQRKGARFDCQQEHSDGHWLSHREADLGSQLNTIRYIDHHLSVTHDEGDARCNCGVQPKEQGHTE